MDIWNSVQLGYKNQRPSQTIRENDLALMFRCFIEQQTFRKSESDVRSILIQGGLKTVVWTDLFQGLLMMTGLGIILGRGIYLAGGVSRVWEVSVATKRVEWANWDPSPFTRNTTLGIFCGQVRITILIGSSKWMDLLMEF